MSKWGATGFVAALIGALALPIAALVALHTDVDDATKWLPLALPIALIAGGLAVGFAGRRRRRRDRGRDRGG